MKYYYSCWFHLIILLIFLRNSTANSQSNIVTTLPGYNDTLPFKLETGYISVGENEDMQLFYYFIESERDPNNDPLVLWLTGGPGCSGLSALTYENIGPFGFDLESSNGSLPSLTINPYSWTKIVNIIFLDSPVGTGFSYATTPQGYTSNDTKSAKYNYVFLRKWLLNHPTFLKNRLYVAGDSYGGKIVPMVALEISKGNEAGLEPRMLLKGYAVGNPITNVNAAANERFPYAHRMALISDEYFQLAKSSCQGNYVSSDPNNVQCLYAIRLMQECMDPINIGHILEPKCSFLIVPLQDGDDDHDQYSSQTSVVDESTDLLLLLPKQEETHCRDYYYSTSYVWANDETVQESLHIRKGTKERWARCNSSLPYDSNDVQTVLKYHQLLIQKGYQVLAYSGDHDMIVPYTSTLKWIRALNLTVDDRWRPWTVDGQVAGFTERYKNKEAFLTFATVKGAGHTAPEYKPRECFAMVERWLSLYPL